MTLVQLVLRDIQIGRGGSRPQVPGQKLTRKTYRADGPSSPQMDVSSSPSVLSAQLQESPAAVISAADAAVPEPPRESLPSLSMLTKAQPSPLLRWQLLEIVYAYCCTLRVFHGDWQDESEVGRCRLADVVWHSFIQSQHSSLVLSLIPPFQCRLQPSQKERACIALQGCCGRSAGRWLFWAFF